MYWLKKNIILLLNPTELLNNYKKKQIFTIFTRKKYILENVKTSAGL